MEEYGKVQSVITQNDYKIASKGGFPLGEMTSDFAVKSRRNYFATKLCLIFTWIALTQLLKTMLTFLLSKIRISLLKRLNRTGNKYKKYKLPFILLIRHCDKIHLKVHKCRFENLPVCSWSYKSNTLKISHSYS